MVKIKGRRNYFMAMGQLFKCGNIRCWPDSLQLQSSHRTFGDRGALLQVLEDQLAAGSPDLLHSVGLGVVGQPTSVRNSLNHGGLLKSTSEKNFNRL